MKAYYSDRYVLALPTTHRFPMSKYSRLRERVEVELDGITLIEPRAASELELARAHDLEYIAAVAEGRLTADEVRAIGFPWSKAMAERARRSVGATIGACHSAVLEGVAVNLAGGTHHARRSRGAGYCVFNDSVAAARDLQADACRLGRAMRIAIVDLDVHQGDGTAQITADDDSIFTLSLHGEKNYPARKEQSDLDIALPDGTGDEAYLAALAAALAELQQRFSPQFVIYLAGADPHADDRLGRMSMSKEGLSARDQTVFDFAETLGVPIAVAMAGGYGRDVETTVDVHLQTVRLALRAWSRRQRVAVPLRSFA